MNEVIQPKNLKGYVILISHENGGVTESTILNDVSLTESTALAAFKDAVRSKLDDLGGDVSEMIQHSDTDTNWCVEDGDDCIQSTVERIPVNIDVCAIAGMIQTELLYFTITKDGQGVNGCINIMGLNRIKDAIQKIRDKGMGSYAIRAYNCESIHALRAFLSDYGYELKVTNVPV